jgi:hypothetical protein
MRVYLLVTQQRIPFYCWERNFANVSFTEPLPSNGNMCHNINEIHSVYHVLVSLQCAAFRNFIKFIVNNFFMTYDFMTLPVAYSSTEWQYDWWITYWKELGMRQSWLTLRYNLSIFLEGLTDITENLNLVQHSCIVKSYRQALYLQIIHCIFIYWILCNGRTKYLLSTATCTFTAFPPWIYNNV